MKGVNGEAGGPGGPGGDAGAPHPRPPASSSATTGGPVGGRVGVEGGHTMAGKARSMVPQQDPFSQPNFKQYGSPPHLHPSSPRHPAPSLSPHSPLLPPQRSPHGPSLQVPPGQRPPASAQRGTNVAVSKRTRFALQVQKPTGEEEQEGSKESTVSGMDLGTVPPGPHPPGGLRSPRGGRGARRSRSPGARGGRGGPREEGRPPGEGGREGRGGGRGRAGRGAPSLSTDDDSVNHQHREFIHRGKSR